MFDPELAPQVPPADQMIFREPAQADVWMAMIEQPVLLQTLRENYALCGRYFFMGKSLLEHLNLNHFEMWNESKSYAYLIINDLRDAKPCQACGTTMTKAHSCHVIRQMASYTSCVLPTAMPRTLRRANQLHLCHPSLKIIGRSQNQAREFARRQELAVKSQVITPEGKWPFLQWCNEAKRLKPTSRPAIDMIKMQKRLEDMVEAAQAEQHILRFKALKNTSNEIKHQQICPFLLHLSLGRALCGNFSVCYLATPYGW